MNYSVIYSSDFEKQLKQLSKKYKSLANDLLQLVEELEQEPFIGKSIGGNCFKIRLAIKSKGKGKSGGARVITYVLVTEKEIYLLMIYDKSELSSVSDKEVKEAVKRIRK